jgi:PAS domain S-box-containing protein
MIQKTMKTNPDFANQAKPTNGREKKSYRLTEIIPEAITDGFFTVDRNWIVKKWNGNAEIMLGKKSEDIIGKNFWNEFAEILPLDFYAKYHQAFHQNIPAHFIQYWPEMSQWFDVTAYAGADSLYVYFKNVNGDYQTEQEILLNNARYKLAFNATKDCLWDWNFKTDEIYWLGDAHKKCFGYNVQDAFIPFDFKESCIHPEDKARVLAGLKLYINARAGKVWNDEYRFKKADGSYAFVQDCGYVINDHDNKPYRMIGAIQDITKRKVIEIKMVENETRYRALVHNGSDIIAILSAKGNFNYISPLGDCLGYKVDFFIGKNVFWFIHPDDLQSTINQFKLLKTQKEVEISPFRFINKEGNWRWMETKATNLLNEPGVMGIVANSRDITEKKKSNDELTILSLIAKETTNSVFIADEKGKILWINEAFTTITEYTLSEILGKDSSILHGPETDPKTIEYLSQKIKNRESFDCDIINYSKSGRKYWVHMVGQCVHDQNENCFKYFSIQTDITEKIQMREKLEEENIKNYKEITDAVISARENERQEIAKELHDNINQILSATKLCIEMAKSSDAMNRKALLAKSTNNIMKAIEEIRNLSKNLETQSIKDLGLYGSIKMLLEDSMATHSIKFEFAHHEINEDDLDEKLKLNIFRIVQEQVNNIIKHSKAKHAAVYLDGNTNEVELLVSDDGIGFDISSQKMGLGIKNIIGRAEIHQGKVTIDSTPGKGSRVKVIFSLHKELITV